jgi:hypothetical protein
MRYRAFAPATVPECPGEFLQLNEALAFLFGIRNAEGHKQNRGHNKPSPES